MQLKFLTAPSKKAGGKPNKPNKQNAKSNTYHLPCCEESHTIFFPRKMASKQFIEHAGGHWWEVEWGSEVK